MSNALLYTLTVLIWGSTWFAVSFQLGVVHPLLSISYRFALASLALFAFIALTGRLKQAVFTRREHGWIALQGLFLFCLNYLLFYWGTGFLTTGLVAVVFSSMSLLNSFNQAIIFKIPLNPKVLAGSFIGLIGITLVFWPEIETLSFGDTKVMGIIICLAASYSASLGNMVSLRNTRNNIPVIESNSYGIRYKLTRLDEKAGPYLQNYAWAEPCVYHLSELLQEVHRERNEAIRKAEAGRERMLREFSVSAIGGVVSARLEEASSRS